jgi:hypothetical protein
MNIININDKRFIIRHIINNHDYSDDEIKSLRIGCRAECAIKHIDKLIFADEILDATIIPELIGDKK